MVLRENVANGGFIKEDEVRHLQKAGETEDRAELLPPLLFDDTRVVLYDQGNVPASKVGI